MHLSMVTCSTSCIILSKQTTYIIRIHSSRSDTPIKILDYLQQQKHYTANYSYVFPKICCQHGVSGIRGKNLFRLGLLTSRHRNRMNKTQEMHVCHKLNSKNAKRFRICVPSIGQSYYTACIALRQSLWHCL